MQERLDAEVVERAAEEDRRLPCLAILLWIEARAGAVDDLDGFDERGLPRSRRPARDLWILRRRHHDRCRAAAARLPFVEQHGVGFQVVDAAEIGAVAERPVARRGGDAEHALDLIEQVERIAGRLIELVDEREHRQPMRAADVEQLERLRLDAFGRVEHHDDAVDGEQRAIGVLAEVLVTGRVEQGDVMALQLELERRRADRDAALLFHLHPVGHGMPLGLAAANGAGQLDGAGVQQQLLGQRGLAGVGVRDDRERAAARNLAAEHIRR